MNSTRLYVVWRFAVSPAEKKRAGSVSTASPEFFLERPVSRRRRRASQIT